MMQRKSSMILMLLTVLFLSASAWAHQVDVIPATVKVTDVYVAGSVPLTVLSAARNEWEGFQIVVQAESAATIDDVQVVVTAHPKDDAAAESLSGFTAILYKEHYLTIDEPSAGSLYLHERLAGDYPDPLIPLYDPYAEAAVTVGLPIEMAADARAVIFVDLHIPKEIGGLTASFLEYDFTVDYSIVFAQGEPLQGSIPLVVWDFEMPSTKSMGTAFGVSWSAFPGYHCGPNGDDQACIDRVTQNYAEALHQHRMDPTRLKGPVEFQFDNDGNLLPVDWTAYDAFLGPWVTGSKFSDGIGVARFDVNRFKPGSGIGSFETEDQYAKAAAAFAEHLEAMGWWDKAYIYATDEPWLNGGEETYARIKSDIALLRRYTDLWDDKVLITGPFVPDLEEEVGTWCPVTPMYENWFWLGDEGMAGREEYSRLMDKGKKLWFYVCNANFPPYAGYDIDTSIGHEPRIVKWGTWFEKATGFLYWRVTYWVENDPWNVYRNVPGFDEMFARHGDGLLLYPGDHNGTHGGKGSPEDVAIDGPVVSYRMKQIRDGFEDWELFIMASDLGAEAYVREQVGRAYTQFGNFMFENCESEGMYCRDNQPWTLDPALMEEIRGNVAGKVLHLLQPDIYPDPETSPDDEGDGDVDDDLEADEDGDADAAGSDEDGDVSDDSQPGDEDTAVSEDDGDSGCRSVPLSGRVSLLVLTLGLLLARARKRKVV